MIRVECKSLLGFIINPSSELLRVQIRRRVQIQYALGSVFAAPSSQMFVLRAAHNRFLLFDSKALYPCFAPHSILHSFLSGVLSPASSAFGCLRAPFVIIFFSASWALYVDWFAFQTSSLKQDCFTESSKMF